MSVTGTPVGSGDAAGTYITQADVERIFGTDNVRLWSNLDNDVTTANSTRIQRAIDDAEAQVVAAFRDGRYVVPLVEQTSGALRPVKDVMAKLAGVHLYMSRGSSDDGSDEGDEESGRMTAVKRSAERAMMIYVTGQQKLDLVANGTQPTGPCVI